MWGHFLHDVHVSKWCGELSENIEIWFLTCKRKGINEANTFYNYVVIAVAILTLGAHAQRGLLYLFCLCVYHAV